MDGLTDCALIRHFSRLEDPRIDRQKKHMPIDVVVSANRAAPFRSGRRAQSHRGT